MKKEEKSMLTVRFQVLATKSMTRKPMRLQALRLGRRRHVLTWG